MVEAGASAYNGIRWVLRFLLNKHSFLNFCVAFLVLCLAILTRLWLSPLVGNHAPFVTFYIAVLFTAWYSPVKTTLLIMLLSSLAAAYFFIHPIDSFWVEGTENQVSWFLFFVVGLTAMAFSEARKGAQAQAENNARLITQLNIQLAEEKERLRVTLKSIGDAVIATDNSGRITFINPVAQTLTAWQGESAIGQPLTTVFRIINEETRQPVESPVEKVMQTGLIVGLANHTIVISRDNRETPIDDSAAPIYNKEGEITGIVLVFRDITERKHTQKKQESHLEEIATLQERQRVARDLHDAVSQILFSSSVIAEALPNLIEKKPEKVASSVDLIKRLNRGALAEMRVILRELNYDTLLEFRMSELLAELADAAMAQTNVTIKVETQEEKKLPHNVHLTFYRIAQEAIQNIVKHAETGEAWIRFKAQDRQAVLQIEDKGQGFNPEASSSKGTELNTMRECAKDIGATIQLQSNLSMGTIIEVLWNEA